MEKILEYISKVTFIDATASEEFLSSFELKSFVKGDFILKSGQVCKYYYFIESGLTKSHFYKDEKEFIMTFFKENMLFTEFNSYLTGQPSKYMITALEDTTVYSISKTEIISLCKKYHCIETFFSKLFSFTSLAMMKRISEMLEEDATQRYKNFISCNIELLQRISLGDLSSYLGISQVSLSRIRAKK